MNWIAKGKVNLVWQIIFSFIPGVLIWSFFRIKKLRLFLLMMAGPAVATVSILPLILLGPEYYETCASIINIIPDNSCVNESMLISGFIVNVIYHGFKTYFIIKWSRKWNEDFQNSSSDVKMHQN